MKRSVTRKIDELGRIVIPSDFREALGVRAGEKMEVYVDGETLCCKKLKIKNLNTQDIESLVERLRNRSLYKDKATLEVMDLCMEAATVITDLLARTEAAEARAEKSEREKDAAVFDLLRAEEAAEETNALLDDEVHPACDYSLYLAVHDSVSDIVNWERDNVWRGHKEE